MIDAVTKNGAHSEIGASSYSRWSACPGSVALSRGLPNRSSAFAEEGTDAHTVAASLLEKNTWPAEIPFDEEMKAAVDVYVGHVHELISDQFIGSILIEHKFDLGVVYPGLFGTADCVVYNLYTKTLYVIDYKHGQGIPVEVEKDGKPNPQLLYYGLGAMLTLPYEVERVELTIVQPRCFHSDGNIRTCVISASRLFDFAFEVYESAKRTEDNNAPRVPGSHCRFCPAIAICPEAHENAVQVAKEEFRSELSYDSLALAQTLRKLDSVEAWAKGVRAFAYAELEHGHAIPGFKLVQKRAVRRWKDEQAFVSAVVEKLGSEGTAGFFTTPELKSVAQVEKLLPKAEFALMNEFVSKESSGYALAEESDPRPAAKVDAHEEFSLIEDKT